MLKLISETSFGSKIGGAGGSILGEIKKLVSKITTRGWAAIWVDTQTAIAKASCLLYAKIKALYDAVETEQSPFALQTDVLSGTAKLVTKNSKYFFYSNGDVSSDGKTIIKTNTLEDATSITNMFASEQYLVTIIQRQYGAVIYIYSIGIDGTLALVRTLWSAGMWGWQDKGRSRYENGYFILWDDSKYYLFTDSTIVDGELVLNTADYRTIITYSQDYWCAVQTHDCWLKLKKSADIATLMSATETTIYERTGEYSGLEFGDVQDIDNLLTCMFAQNGGVYPVIILQMDFTDDSVVVTQLPIINMQISQYTARIGKIANQYFITIYTGSTSIGYWLANAITAFIANPTGTGFSIATKNTDSVMTVNSNDIMWSGLAKVVYTKTYKIASEILAGIGASTGITSATVVKTTYEGIITDTDGRTFTFDGTDWKLAGNTVTLADYGISVEGTATTDDEIIISYYQAVITYYKLADGSEVCMPDQQTDLNKVFSEYGVVDFFVLDLENETIKPIRDNTNGYVYLYVGGSYIEATTEVLS